MRDHLVFTLAAPLASFGGLAVGERRPSGNRPTKSQIIGLTAAALGIPRSDAARQQALAASLGFAVRVDEPGLPATDYHTAQRAEDVSARKWVKQHGPLKTRRDELDSEVLKTVLSRREYRTGVLVTIVLWLQQAGPASLAEIGNNIQKPKFALFAGRKAFALMLPCRPVVVRAETIEAALSAYDASRSDAVLAFESAFLNDRLPRRESVPTLYAEVDASLASDTQHIETRRDMPETRDKWRFGLRSERVVALPLKRGTA